MEGLLNQRVEQQDRQWGTKGKAREERAYVKENVNQKQAERGTRDRCSATWVSPWGLAHRFMNVIAICLKPPSSQYKRVGTGAHLSWKVFMGIPRDSLVEVTFPRSLSPHSGSFLIKVTQGSLSSFSVLPFTVVLLQIYQRELVPSPS